MASLYLYVVARDFGFAPNPFHGYCTLATCKPGIRNTASIGDWIFGVGGGRLKATGRCIYAMKVTQKVSFDEYWNNPIYKDKKPVRNGSKKMLIGDNIYHQDKKNNWIQAHSHHSNIDGTTEYTNLRRDTKSPFVLISEHFYYFGSAAPKIPEELLANLPFENRVGHRRYDLERGKDIIDWLKHDYSNNLNLVLADPFDFDQSDAHYSFETNLVTTVLFNGT
ncbi:MAG: hypothetical protein AAF843_04070 [Bacteroidota bacterium]